MDNDCWWYNITTHWVVKCLFFHHAFWSHGIRLSDCRTKNYHMRVVPTLALFLSTHATKFPSIWIIFFAYRDREVGPRLSIEAPLIFLAHSSRSRKIHPHKSKIEDCFVSFFSSHHRVFSLWSLQNLLLHRSGNPDEICPCTK